jgi:hypothetical protein
VSPAPAADDPLGMEYFPIAEVRSRLEAQNGGWEVLHESPNLEVGVLVRIAPTPDPPVRHTTDEVYVVLAAKRPSRPKEIAAGSGPEMPRSSRSAKSTTSSTTN